MGNIFSKKNYCRLSSNRVEETPLGFSTEVSSILRNAKVEYVSDQTLGNASNLIKHEPPTSKFNSIPGNKIKQITTVTLFPLLLKLF